MSFPSQPSSENDERKRKKTPLSKRIISQKIEEMFQDPLHQSSQPNLTENRHPKLDDPKNGIWLSLFPLLKNYMMSYPFLILIGLAAAGGWFFFFFWYYYKPSSTLVTIQVEKTAEWDNGAPFISTPILSDLDGDGEYDIASADSLGYIRAMNPRTQEMIYQTYLGGPLIASLAKIEVDGKPPTEILAAAETGKFFTINSKGDYLYQSRDEYFSQSLFAKPLVLQEAGVFFLAGMKGEIWGVGINYGEVLWVNDNSPLAQEKEGIFAPLILLPLDDHPPLSVYLKENPGLPEIGDNYALIAVGERGIVSAFNPGSGGLRWVKYLDDSFKAAPAVFNWNNNNYLILVGVQGSVWLIDSRGEVINNIRLNEVFISSPVTGKFLNSERQAVIFSESGNGFLITLNSGPGLRIEQILSGNEGFISTPIAVDWNQDGRDDLLAVSREGTLFLWEITALIQEGDQNGNRLKDLITPYRLGFKVTATPVVGDLNQDGHSEIIIAGENGKLTMLTLRTNPPLFSPGELLSPQFLKNSLHER